MTLADQAAITGQDGQVTSGKPGRPKRRTFTAAYKARILAAFDALPEGSPERNGLAFAASATFDKAATRCDMNDYGDVHHMVAGVPRLRQRQLPRRPVMRDS
jgi:hypothetical protein